MTDKTIEQRARELLAEVERGPARDYGTVHRRIAHDAIARALQQQGGSEGVQALLGECCGVLDSQAHGEPVEGSLRWRLRTALAAMGWQREDDAWKPSNSDYDRSIHSNPDASAWADLFVATFPGLADKRDLMLGWFANAMMAMHDHVSAKPVTVTPEVLMAVASFFHDGPVRDWRVVRSIEAYLASGRAAPQQPEGREAVARKPDGYAYRYPSTTGEGTVIRFTCGQDINGSRAIEAIPYFYGTPPARVPEIAELREALDSIRQFGSDTLSGRVDGPTDREWFKDGVREMTRRARLALAATQQPKEGA